MKHLLTFLVALYILPLTGQTPEPSETLTSYIEKNFNVLYLSPKIESPEEADMFLLAEDHQCVGHKKILSTLVNQFSSPEDFVLIEGVPSMVEMEPSESLQTMWITAPVKICGWDSGWLNDLVGRDLSRIEKLGIKLFQIQHDIVTNRAFTKIMQYYDVIFQLLPMSGGIEALLKKKIKERFAEREEAMVESLNILRSNSENKIFLIAGPYQLWHEETAQILSDPSVSLTPLYDYLDTQKAVILIPNQEMTDHWKNRYSIL